MKTVVYTSAALNYLAKARVLADSVRQHDPEVELVLLLNDRWPAWLDQDDEPFDHIWHPRDLDLGMAPEPWIYRHNVMELCTAVKGPALVKIFNELQPDLAMYLDPDSLVFGPTSMIDEMLGDGSIGLAPHICRPEESDEGVRLTEMSVLKHGTYNLGFLAVRGDERGKRLADWWADRLRKYCYIDFERGLFTDQRWMDLVPAVFDGVEIIKHPGVDLASWNASGRDLQLTDDGYLVDGERLFFYHFSGVGPKGVHRWVRDKMVYDSVGYASIEADYEALLATRGQHELEHLEWGYNRYSNGDLIEARHREEHRKLPDGERFGDPFLAGPDTWYDRVTSKRGRSSKAGVRKPRTGMLFDANHYEDQLRSRAIDGEATIAHYRSTGWTLGLEPNRFFVTGHYLTQAQSSPEYRVVSALEDFSPLDHFAEIGVAWNRSPCPFFENGWYERANPDVRAAIEDGGIASGYEHYVRFGASEGRNPGPRFHEAGYLDLYPDVAAAVEQGDYVCGFDHYLRFGWIEGRLTPAVPALGVSS